MYFLTNHRISVSNTVKTRTKPRHDGTHWWPPLSRALPESIHFCFKTGFFCFCFINLPLVAENFVFQFEADQIFELENWLVLLTGIQSSGVSEDMGDLLDTVKVFDLNGNGIPISDLWEDRKAVIAFARHFG